MAEDKEELQVTDSFGDKIRLLMEDINQNIDQTYQRLDQIEEKIKDNDEIAKEYDFHCFLNQKVCLLSHVF